MRMAAISQDVAQDPRIDRIHAGRTGLDATRRIRPHEINHEVIGLQPEGSSEGTALLIGQVLLINLQAQHIADPSLLPLV